MNNSKKTISEPGLNLSCVLILIAGIQKRYKKNNMWVKSLRKSSQRAKFSLRPRVVNLTQTVRRHGTPTQLTEVHLQVSRRRQTTLPSNSFPHPRTVLSLQERNLFGCYSTDNLDTNTYINLELQDIHRKDPHQFCK
jgi:hypothetical protein